MSYQKIRLVIVMLSLFGSSAVAQERNKTKILGTTTSISDIIGFKTVSSTPETDSLMTTRLEKVLVRPAHTQIQIHENWERVTEQILVKPQSREGATFTTEREEIIIRFERRKLVLLPAQWEIMQKQITVETDCDGKQETANYTIYMLIQIQTVREIEMPTEWAFIEKQIEKTPGTGAEVPAVYQTITKIVVKTPDTVTEYGIPEEFKTFTVRKCNTAKSVNASEK